MMENFEFQTAENFINFTNTPIFLTGKAGTGKTTFLRHITQRSLKKSIVVAPTGVAAINAGGVTIHSMFGLPTKLFVHTNEAIDPNLANNRQMLASHFHYRREKLRLLYELELLVVDEVSMVRADLLDAVDFALRFVRKTEKPFGGVQVLFIGDMYQLPPVVKEDEWPLMSKYYNSPYFFDSKVFQLLDPIYIELKKIYRQTDRGFINILNNIRHQDLQEDDYEQLKTLYKPDFQPTEPGFITLTTHNKKADAINERELQKLPGNETILDAKVSGDFMESMYPTEMLLRLKIGAQVMFVKNDTSGERKYFNGKIGLVEDIDEDEGLTISFPDSREKITVKQEIWENIRYSINENENKIEQDRIGSFTQYPLRLAWAITIHKSQGLTFEKAVIDAGESFAPGQVYVALSRCTSMDNLVLHSLITNRNIISDPRIIEFSDRVMGAAQLEYRLEEDQKVFAFESLVNTFRFENLRDRVENWERKVAKIKSVNPFEVRKLASESTVRMNELVQVAKKFQDQLRSIYGTGEDEATKTTALVERSAKAIEYFTEKLYVQIIQVWEKHLENYRYKAKMKKYLAEGDSVLNGFWGKIDDLFNCSMGERKMYTMERKIWRGVATSTPENKKPAKGETFADTLELFKQGLGVEEIATKRGLAVTTIEKHLEQWLLKGEILISQLLPEVKITEIQNAIRALGDSSSGPLKASLGDDYSFAEIRWVISSEKSKKSAKA